MPHDKISPKLTSLKSFSRAPFHAANDAAFAVSFICEYYTILSLNYAKKFIKFVLSSSSESKFKKGATKGLATLPIEKSCYHSEDIIGFVQVRPLSTSSSTFIRFRFDFSVCRSPKINESHSRRFP